MHQTRTLNLFRKDKKWKLLQEEKVNCLIIVKLKDKIFKILGFNFNFILV